MQLASANSTDYKNSSVSLRYYDSVDQCPICLAKGQPKFRTAHNEYPANKNEKLAWFAYQCPNNDCQKLFIAEFACGISNTTPIYSLKKLYPKTIIVNVFPKEIDEVSKQFNKIYSEASEAEQLGLEHICGPGYRKSLEFLIKDYCTWLNPENETKVKGSLLAQVIKNYVNDSRIQSAASRAVWLGNDETHYERKWIDKDINDMKTLIKLVVNFIESEVLMKKYETEMT